VQFDKKVWQALMNDGYASHRSVMAAESATSICSA
jgi:hypothetical protein